MVGWRRFLRVLLVAVVAAVVGAVVVGLRDRADPAQALVVDRADPEAIIETRGSRILQADALGDNLQIVSGTQATYEDGAMRLFDGVEVTVAEREDRTGFDLTADEAVVDDQQTQVQLTGTVRMAASDGLRAVAEDAEYAKTDGVVRMPGQTSFEWDDMTAGGVGAEFDRDSDLVSLFSRARVALTSDGGLTTVTSRSATIDQPGGRMHFQGDVAIVSETHEMQAGDARLETLPESSVLQALSLEGDARIVGLDATAGALRTMGADEVALGYDESGQALDGATLDGGAALELYGTGGGPGSAVAGDVMVLAFATEGEGIETLESSGDVRLATPGGEDTAAQTVTASTLQVTTAESGQAALFDGGVTFREVDDESERVTRADRLEATLGDGWGGLTGARFVGDVVLETGDAVGRAGEARYDVTAGEVELVTVPASDRVPRLEDAARGSIQGDTLVLGLDDGSIRAQGGVESVLSAAGEQDVRRPGMLDAAEAIFVTAGALVYDDELATTTYTGSARLWQSTTKFDGEEIVLDEQAGNIGALGSVRTESMISQINDLTGLPEASLTRGEAQRFAYEDETHRATYDSGARLSGPRGDLTADLIHVYLQADGQTLERIEAEGTVSMELTDRWVSGETLVYYDADGRYEMDGEPVRIIERGASGCRETTGRTLTFFLTEDAVEVDGESEVRTAAAGVPCPTAAP